MPDDRNHRRCPGHFDCDESSDTNSADFGRWDGGGRSGKARWIEGVKPRLLGTVGGVHWRSWGGRGNALVPYMGEARREVPTECLLWIMSMHRRLENWRLQESRRNDNLGEQRSGVAVKDRLVQGGCVSAASVRLTPSATCQANGDKYRLRIADCDQQAHNTSRRFGIDLK
jgi:hypothetical protein